jgi:hypothetical protein
MVLSLVREIEWKKGRREGGREREREKERGREGGREQKTSQCLFLKNTNTIGSKPYP